jgi:transposase
LRSANNLRVYPQEEQEKKLLETLELCRQTYNYFLAWLNGVNRVSGRVELQAQLSKLKKEKPELNKVYSKTLQMVLYQLYLNPKALSRVKKNDRGSKNHEKQRIKIAKHMKSW